VLAAAKYCDQFVCKSVTRCNVYNVAKVANAAIFVPTSYEQVGN